MKIKDIAYINPNDKLMYNEFINYIDTSSVYDGSLLGCQLLIDSYPSRARRIILKDDILISSVRPNLLHNYFVKDKIENGVASTGFIHIRIKNNNFIPRFIYYYLTSSKNINKYVTIANSSQTAYPTMNKTVIEKIKIPTIKFDKQQHIVDIIGSIDDKIENNIKIIEKINNFMMFNFKKIFKKSCDNNSFVDLKNIICLKTGKKDANAAVEDGIYPFFTCSEKESQIDEYSFDQEAIIIAGNGNMDVKYYKGKFDAYQRTYVISSTKYFYYLYLYYKNFINDIAAGARGSVIKFLTKSMLTDIQIPLPKEEELTLFESNIQKLLNCVLELEKENKKLIELKQNYLLKFFQ